MQPKLGGNLFRVKLSNQVAIREMIYQHGPITRAEVSQRLGLTMPTITTNVNAMIANGIVHEVSPLPSDDKIMGRPANPIDIVADARYFIGVEMRGAYRRLCLTDLRGTVLYTDAHESSIGDYDQALDSACALIRKVLESDLVPWEKISRIGFCIPGIVDTELGTLVVHPGYNWVNKPLRQDVRRLTGFTGPVVIENNARARANAALLFRGDITQDAASFAYLFISTGIACPFLLNNGLTSSVALGAGEVGHTIVDPLGPKCVCGNRGCLEAVSSDAAILRACREAMDGGGSTLLTSLCDGEPLTMAQVLSAQKEGDPVVTRIVSRALYYIGLAIANIYNFIRPDILLIEGKLFTIQENRRTMLNTVYDNLYSTIQDTNFVFLDPDINSGAMGACATAIRDYLQDFNS